MSLKLKITLITVALSVAAALGGQQEANAYPSRVHMKYANDLRAELIRTNDGTIQLMLGNYHVELTAQDADAIINNPLEFRAGAISPDNFVFPGMTDLTHAIGLSPFEQCELIYQAAVIESERAYALGCFVHGTGDAIVHHLVNYLAGETFTLNPMSNDRLDGWDNVVRHIVAESMVQDAVLNADNTAYEASKLMHNTPAGFALRIYFDESSPLWQLMTTHAQVKYAEAKAASPGAPLSDVIANSGLAPAEHVGMTPVYLREVDALLDDVQIYIEDEIARLQDISDPDGFELGVTAGNDGLLGTEDDETDCSATCPQLFATYFTYVGLLAPRETAGGDPLPSAYEKIIEKLRADLFGFFPALHATITNISVLLNTPLQPGDDSGIAITEQQVTTAFQPLQDWVDQMTTIDYDTLIHAVLPGWILDLEQFLTAVGVNVSIAGLLEYLFQPVIAQVQEAIDTYVIGTAKTYLEELATEYAAQVDVVHAEFSQRLADDAPATLGGDGTFDYFMESGLYAHSFNIGAVTLAERRMALPNGTEYGGWGPASFDASWTFTWMQPAVCSYLTSIVFPLGLDLRGILSVQIGDTLHTAANTDDAPIECHDGSATAFTSSPSPAACALTDVPTLTSAATPQGSLSRSFPPSAVGANVECENIVVPGLPLPPEDPDAGVPDGGVDPDGGTTGDPDPKGCGGCSTSGGGAGGSFVMLFMVLGIFLARRRRNLMRFVPIMALATLVGLGTVACSDDSGNGTNQNDAAVDNDGDVQNDVNVDPDSGPDADAAISPRALLLAALGDSVWHGTATRGGTTRGYELHFRADSLMWAEIRNPYGPARLREMRGFTMDEDATVHSTVITPNGWPINPENGRQDDWTIVVTDGNPRTLTTTRNGDVETFEEGAWPIPESGLTATVYVFTPGQTMDDAFCSSGLSGFDYNVILQFSRGNLPLEVIETDRVAGAPLVQWADVGNNFSIVDVAGFDQLGGTELSDQFNFVVHYRGVIEHPGGSMSMRELDDSVEDALWVFLDSNVGSSNVNDIFLEVHGFWWADATADEPSATFPAGDVEFEAMLVRCAVDFEGDPIDVQLLNANTSWTHVGNFPSRPEINTTLFPPAF